MVTAAKTSYQWKSSRHNCQDKLPWKSSPTFSGVSPASSALCDFVFDFNIIQVIESPTHTKGNILDLILSNTTDLIEHVNIWSDSFLYSDHFLLDFYVKIPNLAPPRNVLHSRPVLDYSKADYVEMNNFLLDYDFSDFLVSTDVEFIWQLLKSSITTAISLFTPTFKHPKCNHPCWFTSDIHHQINCIRTLKRRCRTTDSPALSDRLVTMEAHLQEDILTSKSDFEAKLVYDFSHSKSSKIFSYIKSISKQDSFPPTMSLENMVASTDQSKAELFNQFFFSVYSQRSSEVSFLSSLPAKVLI